MPEGPGLCGGGVTASGNGNGSIDGDLRARCVALEKAYVHEVYRQLSANNNNITQLTGSSGGTTAAAPAPKLLANVTAFLSELEPASVVADIGCGPGRYLSCRPDLTVIGVDSCWGMAEQCRSRARIGRHDALCADNLRLPLRDETFDAVLSVAVVHHFASKERRIEALRELARITRIGGRVLITVWAMDGWRTQSDALGRRFESQDILVPYRQPSICPACHNSSHTNNVQNTLVNNLSGSVCGANGGCPRLQKRLRRSCAVSYSTATSEDDCQSERDFSIFSKPRLRRWVFTRGRSLEDSCSSDQSTPSDTCYSFVRRAVQRLSSASSSESRRSYFHRVCRRPWLTDSTDSGTISGINVSLSSAERMSESPDLFEEEIASERHEVSKSESFDSDDLCDDDGFIELRNLDPETPEEEQTGGENPKDRVSPLPPIGGLKHRSRSLGDMFSMIPSLLMRSRRRRSARNVDLQKRASTVSDPREYLLRSKDKNFVSRSSSTTSEGFMRFDYFRFLQELSPEDSLNGNSSPTPIVEEKLEASEENEPLLRLSDDENLVGGASPPPPWWMLEPRERTPAVEVEFSPTHAADVSLPSASLEQPVSLAVGAIFTASSSASVTASIEVGIAGVPHALAGRADTASAVTVSPAAAAVAGASPGGGGASDSVIDDCSGEFRGQWQHGGCTGPEAAGSFASRPLQTPLASSQHRPPMQRCQELLHTLSTPVGSPIAETATATSVAVQSLQTPIASGGGVALTPQIGQQQQQHVDLASRRRLKFQGTRLQERALRNQFSKKSSFDRLLRRRSMARSYFSMPNLNVFSAAFNERSPASHLRVLLKRPPAPDLTELERKLGIIDEQGNLRNPLRPTEHRGSLSSHVPLRLPARRSQSIEVGAGAAGGSFSGSFGVSFGTLPSLRPALNRRYSLSAVQGNSSSLVPGIPSRSWVSKARHDSLKSDTSVESESDSVVSVIYRSKTSAGGTGSNGGGGGLSDNSIDSEESIVSVIHRSTDDTPRAGSANGNGNRSWQASPLTISQTGSREGSFSSPEYSPTLKSAPIKSEKISCKLWETCLTEVDDEHASDTRSVSPQPPSGSASAPPSTLEPADDPSDHTEPCDVGTEHVEKRVEDQEVGGEEQEVTKEVEKEKVNSPQLTPSSSSDDAPYMSDEEVQCEEIPESFELENTEPLTAISTPIDLSRLQPPPTRRMCSPVDPLELEDDDVLESIPEEDESCSPIKSPRGKQGEGTHFPMPAPEHSRLQLQQKQPPDAEPPSVVDRRLLATTGLVSAAAPIAKTNASTFVSTAASAASRLPQRIASSPSLTTRSTPTLHVVSVEATDAVIASTAADREHTLHRRSQSMSSRSSGVWGQPVELRQLHQQLLPTAAVGAECPERIIGARPQEDSAAQDKPPGNNGSPLVGQGPTKTLADTERGVVATLHSKVPEQKSSANSPCTSTSCCMTVGGVATMGPLGAGGGLIGNSNNSSGNSPLRSLRGLPSRPQTSDSNRRASDVGPQSKCPKDRAKFSPQYSLPDQKKFQKELTASCEQLFRRRLSPQRQQQEIRSDPLNELIRGSVKSATVKSNNPSDVPTLGGLQQLPSTQQWDDPRSRGIPTSVSPEPLGVPGPWRRTPELRTSPLEMLAQELRSSTDDLYRRAAASTDLCQLAVDPSYAEISPERQRTPDYLQTLPDPRFEDAAEDGAKRSVVSRAGDHRNNWLPQILPRIYSAKSTYDCDEHFDELSELHDIVPQTTRYIGGRISAQGDILYSDRDSPEDTLLCREHSFLSSGLQGIQETLPCQAMHSLQNISVCTSPTSPEQFSDADESNASTTDQEISDLSSSLERLRVSSGLQPEITAQTSAQPPNLNIVIEDFSDQGGSDAEISEACSSNATSGNANQLYVQERQGGSSSLSDHSDRSSASVQTVYKLDTPSKDVSPEVALELQATEIDVAMDPITGGDEADAQQEKLSLTSSSSEDSSDENFGDSCCGTMTGHSAETYHRYYHVFKQGELDSLIEKYVHSLHILKSYYDHSNWCIVAERVQVWTI